MWWRVVDGGGGERVQGPREGSRELARSQPKSGVAASINNNNKSMHK